MSIAAVRDSLDRWLGRGSVVGSDPFVAPTALDRPLTEDEDAAVRWILWLEDFPGAGELRARVPHVRATFGRTTEIDLEVLMPKPASVADGILPVDALGRSTPVDGLGGSTHGPDDIPGHELAGMVPLGFLGGRRRPPRLIGMSDPLVTP